MNGCDGCAVSKPKSNRFFLRRDRRIAHDAPGLPMLKSGLADDSRLRGAGDPGSWRDGGRLPGQASQAEPPRRLENAAGGFLRQSQEHLRFLREAEAVARLRHPNIVQIYDFGEVDGHPYFTMEYISGGSLADKLAGVPQPVRESAQMVASLAQAVHAAHQGGIIHRDVKPANVMLADDGTPKIGDFGLARRLDGDAGLTHTGVRDRDAQLHGARTNGGQIRLDRSRDRCFCVWGRCSTRCSPGNRRSGATRFRTRSARLATADPEPPSRRNAKVPRDLETICLKCLEKDPKRRYATAEDLADELARFLRHEPILARPVPPAERWMRWIRRNPLLAALAVTAAVAVRGDRQRCDAGRSIGRRRREKARLTARFDSGVRVGAGGALCRGTGHSRQARRWRLSRTCDSGSIAL